MTLSVLHLPHPQPREWGRPWFPNKTGRTIHTSRKQNCSQKLWGCKALNIVDIFLNLEPGEDAPTTKQEATHSESCSWGFLTPSPQTCLISQSLLCLFDRFGYKWGKRKRGLFISFYRWSPQAQAGVCGIKHNCKGGEERASQIIIPSRAGIWEREQVLQEAPWIQLI